MTYSIDDAQQQVAGTKGNRIRCMYTLHTNPVDYVWPAIIVLLSVGNADIDGADDHAFGKKAEDSIIAAHGVAWCSHI
ncbi:MAG: hypothetical protein GXP63_07195 [DPANN group archaeon]|nr:hypothetical protein [DPANN group archaeon]